MEKKIKVLFVCVHNSARSQMAEAFLNELGSEFFFAESAGLEAGTLNPLAVAVMKEEGIDISNNKTKSAFDFFKQGKLYHYVITVCDESSKERCPLFPGITKRIHWSFDDPSSLTGSEEEKLEKTRQIRDHIKAAVEDFIRNVK
ncbi:Protein ArsC [Desulfamplus magnetovallimortis]|uniref:Protein ArsC n=1 Tax=Desulfamplus magnetovallimortis TaxID=1246637 RepID=A0A1W1HID5_9BACT|nr:arsenate reductase ArsC [Desulfamplus magnetovallimortis]SLM32261.1 Protein ArsC [Desulfamplus magnetovallimortis]